MPNTNSDSTKIGSCKNSRKEKKKKTDTISITTGKKTEAKWETKKKKNADLQ